MSCPSISIMKSSSFVSPVVVLRRFIWHPFCLLVAAVLFGVTPSFAGVTPEQWDMYLAKVQAEPVCTRPCPGRLLASISPAFSEAWKYRPMTYELHYDDTKTLARAVYDLAVHSGDIPVTTPREQVENGVQGFHYSVDQICTWIDDVFSGKRGTVSHDSLVLIGYLLKDSVVRVDQGKFKPVDPIRHILAASAGSKRTLDDNLRHERLHVFWDEDESFRQHVRSAWDAMSDAGRKEAENKMKQYANNFDLRLEEWGVREVLSGRMGSPDI